jgi:hypothetical protein
MSKASFALRWRAQVAGLILLASAPSAAQAASAEDEHFCTELARTVEAIALGDLTSLQSGTSPPEFGFRYGCVAQGLSWLCHQSLAPPSLSLQLLAGRVASCRPDLSRTEQNRDRLVLFEGPGLRIRILEAGARGAHVGRIVTLLLDQGQQTAH